MTDLVTILIFSSSAFVILFIISKLLGKKQIAELNFIDYVVGISIGSIAAEMATELEKDYWVYLVAMGIFFLLDFIVSFLGIKANWLKKFFKGTPIVVIDQGKLNYEGLKKSKLDVNEINGLARLQGYFDIEDIEFAIFETNGELSILPKGAQKPVVIEDLGIKPEKQTLTEHVVVDGKISDTALKNLKKNKSWVLEKLNIKKPKQLKKVLLASYDNESKTFNIHYK